MPQTSKIRPSFASSHILQHTPRPRCSSQCSPTQTNTNLGSVRYAGTVSEDRAMSRLQDSAASSMQSRKTRTKNMSSKDIPSDLGLLPHLFIFPRTNGAAPRFFSKDIAKRIKLELFYLREQAKNIAALWWELRYSRDREARIPLALRDRVPTALSLHRNMYANLSAGQSAVLDRICCETLAGKLRNQVDRRQKSSAAPIPPEWRLEKYNGPPEIPPAPAAGGKWLRRMLWFQFPSSALWGYLASGIRAKVVSDRATAIPFGPNLILRQVVVRIRSRQSLMQPRPASTDFGSKVLGERKSRDLTEYVVIQKLVIEGRDTEAEWKIWGTVEEADKEGVEKLLSSGWSGMEGQQSQRLSAMDRIKATMM